MSNKPKPIQFTEAARRAYESETIPIVTTWGPVPDFSGPTFAEQRFLVLLDGVMMTDSEARAKQDDERERKAEAAMFGSTCSTENAALGISRIFIQLSHPDKEPHPWVTPSS